MCTKALSGPEQAAGGAGRRAGWTPEGEAGPEPRRGREARTRGRRGRREGPKTVPEEARKGLSKGIMQSRSF